MPQKIVKFSGINRKVNEFQGSGACEELINLRPDITGVHRVVKQKDQIWKGAYWGKVYEHSFGDVHNLIGVRTNGMLDIIHSKIAIPFCTEFNSGDVELTFAGNVLVAYSADEKKQLVYKYEDGKYTEQYLEIKNISDISVSYVYNKNNTARAAIIPDDLSIGGLNDAIAKASSAFYVSYPNGLCGVSIIGFTYELKDGSEIWSTAFTVLNATRINGYKAPDYTPMPSDETQYRVMVYGASNVELTITFDDLNTSEIRKVNVYATRPILPYESRSLNTSSWTFKKIPLEDMNLSGQLMYYQGSVTPNQNTVTFVPNFEREQAGESIMNVTSGCIKRIGEIVSYNNRFHYYRSDVEHVIQTPMVSEIYGKEYTEPWVAYVKYNDTWKLINKVYKFSVGDTRDFTYPMIGVEKIVFVKAEYDNNNNLVVPFNASFTVNLNDSSAYNYSYAFDIKVQIDDTNPNWLYEIAEKTGQLWGNGFNSTVFWKKESNAINVSAQYNPFVFPVEHSYSFSGEIKDIATSYLPISATQIGQYPLTVFTSNGIFAMEQGSGTVLYSNIIPLQPMVSDNKAVTTPYGTFFTSSKSLYMLSGRDTANMSYVLNGELETNLRELDAYKILCCGKKGAFYDFSPLLSSKDFEEYITGATLTYDQLNNELLISNNDPYSMYSYVLNLDTKAYHKVGKKYVSVQNGARYILEQTRNVKNIVDMHTEEKGVQPILLQSRPLSLEAFHTHIQRLILMADAKLTYNQNLSISVFGSDNLYDWKCIISAQKHNTVLRQIRTNKAPKSYRDYIIIISGTVDTDTDISDLIADYTVVTRRLG